MKLNTNPISRLLILILLMCSILACSENKEGVNAPRAVEIRND
jgi:hypothetical protein